MSDSPAHRRTQDHDHDAVILDGTLVIGDVDTVEAGAVRTEPQAADAKSKDERLTIPAMIDFANRDVRLGFANAHTARHRINAVGRLCSVLDDDEELNIFQFRNSLNYLAKRLMTRDKLSAPTAHAYRQRAGGLVDDYLNWLRNPTQYDHDREIAKATAEKPGEYIVGSFSSVGPKTPFAVQQPGWYVQPSFTFGGPSRTLRSFPLPGGDGSYQREIEFNVPPDFNTDDLARFVVHLMSFAQDFNPTALKEMKSMLRTAARTAMGITQDDRDESDVNAPDRYADDDVQEGRRRG